MVLCRWTGPGRVCKGWRCLAICWKFQMTGERNTERFCAGTDGYTDTLDGEQGNESEKERERRAGAREQDAERQNLLDAAVHLSRAAATASTHTPLHTHTADTHCFSQQCRTDWLHIYYALASSALRPDAFFFTIIAILLHLGEHVLWLKSGLFISLWEFIWVHKHSYLWK